MATVKMAGSSLMDVVTSTSGAVISTANTISQTVGWAEAAMSHIRIKQKKDHARDLHMYDKRRNNESALEHAQLMKNIKSTVEHDEFMQDQFNQMLSELEALTNEK